MTNKLRLSADAIEQAIRFRHILHAQPELSGQEGNTHNWLVKQLKEIAPDARLIDNLGEFKTGLAAIFSGKEDGKTVLLRADTDALPIQEATDLPYSSRHTGKMHACGHDGHTSLLLGLASIIQQQGLAKGSLVLLFQPSEENGKGANSLLQDERFTALKPDLILGCHNLPGLELGKVVSKPATICYASTGLKISLEGNSSHAAEPEKASSAAKALSQALVAIHKIKGEKSKIAITHASLGEPSFGITAGSAKILLTIRAPQQDTLDGLCASIRTKIEDLASENKLKFSSELVEPFIETYNNPELLKEGIKAFEQAGISYQELEQPFYWSEDFGNYKELAPICFFGLGAGETTKPLHHPAYNFPDALIEKGLAMWLALVNHFLN